MKFSKIVCLSFVVFFSLSAAAQQDERDKKYTPPENSYLGSKGLSTGSSGSSSSNDYSLSRCTTWEISALTRGALVMGQDFRLGRGRWGISTQIGVNIFTDYVQSTKVENSESEYGYISYDHLSLRTMLVDGKKSAGPGLWFQGGITFDLNEPNSSLEFGFRIIKSAFDVDGTSVANYFGYVSSSYPSLYGIPIRTFTPYVAFKQYDTKTASSFVTSVRVGLGVRFYRFETYKSEYYYNSFGQEVYQLVKDRNTYSEGPKLAILITFGIGRGKKMK